MVEGKIVEKDWTEEGINEEFQKLMLQLQNNFESKDDAQKSDMYKNMLLACSVWILKDYASSKGFRLLIENGINSKDIIDHWTKWAKGKQWI